MQFVELDGIDDANDRRIDWPILAFRRHPRGTPRDHQDRFAEAGVYGVDRNQVTRLVRSVWADRLYDEELLAFEACIFSRGNHCTDDACKKHARLRTKR